MTAPGELRAALLAALEDGPATALELRRRVGVDRPMDTISHALRAMRLAGLVTRTGRRGGGTSAGYTWSLPAQDVAVPEEPTPAPSVDRRELLTVSTRLRLRPSEAAALDERAERMGIDRSELIRRLLAQAMGVALTRTRQRTGGADHPRTPGRRRRRCPARP